MCGLCAQLWCSSWLKAEQLHPERSPHQSSPAAGGLLGRKEKQVEVLASSPQKGQSGLNQGLLRPWPHPSRFFFLNKLFHKFGFALVQSAKYYESSVTLARSETTLPFGSAFVSTILWYFSNEACCLCELASEYRSQASPSLSTSSGGSDDHASTVHVWTSRPVFLKAEQNNSRLPGVGRLEGGGGVVRTGKKSNGRPRCLTSQRKKELKWTKHCIYALPV